MGHWLSIPPEGKQLPPIGRPRARLTPHPHPGSGDPRLSRSHPNPGHPVRLTQPDLHRMRKLLTPPLSIRRMEILRPRVHTIVDELLDKLAETGTS